VGRDVKEKEGMLRWAVKWAFAGVTIAVCLLVAGHLIANRPNLVTGLGYRVWQTKVVLWPASVFLMAAEGIERTAQGWLILLLSIAANGLLYGLVGCLFWLVKRIAASCVDRGGG
jgi:hypothetical protein